MCEFEDYVKVMDRAMYKGDVRNACDQDPTLESSS